MRIVMMGTGSFAEPTFTALLRSPHQVVGLVTQPDRAAGDKRGSTRQAEKSLKEIAVEHGLPVLQPESINTPDGVRGLQALAPELLVVAAYGQILSREVLAAAPQGGINVHASLLPKYRGAAPINWAIYHGEQESGVTIIRMTLGLDAGDMLMQEAVPIDADETAGTLEARLAPLGARMVLTVADQVAAGAPFVGIKQDKALVTKAPKLTKEHGLIDWSRGAGAVCNQVRAMQPWPTAYTFLYRPGQPRLRLLVQKASVAEREPNHTPGTVVKDGTRLLVHTGQGAVEILELQPSGKRRMAAQEFLRGNPLPAGAVMGGETPNA